MRIVWMILGGSVLVLAILGAVLPLLPTVPFLLLAAFCFAKSSPKTHDWLLNHKSFGPPIKDWQQNGAIKPRAKRLATLVIGLTFLISVFMGIRLTLLLIQASVLCCVLVFIWSRPNA